MIDHTRAPSIKGLCQAFDITTKEARLIRQLVKADRYALETLITDPDSPFPVTRKWANSCYSSPFTSRSWRADMRLSAISEVLGCHGVESSCGKDQDPYSYKDSPRYRYANAGDTYAATLLLDLHTGRVWIGCWGDLAEAGRV